MSTENQRYSIENQLATIRPYAEKHGMAIVRTYADEGKSGLNLRGRKGLQALLADVGRQAIGYTSILVYDISRWGRFQDVDESAYYEYQCKRVGVRVIYCAEQFEDDGSPMAAIQKVHRRVMAAQTSRDLSTKVFIGKCRLINLGFRQGGQAGFGFRRLLVDGDGTPKGLLRPGDRKALITDRVILVPGVKEEVEAVWRVYDMFVYDHLSELEIAAWLNKHAPRPVGLKKWGRAAVANILSNAKYVGDNVFNRESCKLLTPRLPNPKEIWIIKRGAFSGLVTRELFDRAQVERKWRATPYSTIYLKRKLRALLQKKGELTVELINKEPGMPAAVTYWKRFGGMREAYAAIGYCNLNNINWVETKKNTRKIQTKVLHEIARGFERAGASVKCTERVSWLTINGGWSISVGVLRSQNTVQRGLRWNFRIRESLSGDLVLMVRLDRGNTSIKDYSLIPHCDVGSIQSILQEDSASVRKYRIGSLNELYGRGPPERRRYETSTAFLSLGSS